MTLALGAWLRLSHPGASPGCAQGSIGRITGTESMGVKRTLAVNASERSAVVPRQAKAAVLASARACGAAFARDLQLPGNLLLSGP